MKRRSKIARPAFFLVCSVLAFILLYLAFFAVGGVAFWYGCVLLKIRVMGESDLPVMLPIVLLIGSLLLVYIMFGSLAAIRKINRPDLKEITKAEHPQLFRLIDETAAGLHVSPPRKVYLSATVSASIFLKTGFWNMFFPANKRLEIGVGLINILNQDELRGVIAHELGHFSQKTMRLNKSIYVIGQSIRYLREKIKPGKRGTIEEQYYGFTYIFQSFAELLFSRLSNGFSVLSKELEYDADRIAAEYIGKDVLISALRKVSFASQTFDFILNSLSSLAASGKGVTNFYAAQNCIISLPDSKLSALTARRIEKLRSVEELLHAPQTSAMSENLITSFAEVCNSITRDIYQNQFGVDFSTLDICPIPLYNKWIAKYFAQLEASTDHGKEVEIEIILEPRLHRTPLTELPFDVYWDDKKLGRGRCRKGFILKTRASIGEHRLKIESQYIKDISLPITIETEGKYTVRLDYKHVFWKAYYLFFVKDVKIL